MTYSPHTPQELTNSCGACWRKQDIIATREANGGGGVSKKRPDLTSGESKKLPDLTSAEGRREIMRRAQEGDAAVVPALRRMLREDDDELIDSGHLARMALARAAAREGDLLTREIYIRQMEKDAEELAGPNPSPLEKVLAERVAISRFRCYYYECLCVMGLRKDTLNLDDHKHKRLARAQRDFLSACRALAQVRKLELPFVQVNVADKQQVQNLVVTGAHMKARATFRHTESPAQCVEIPPRGIEGGLPPC
jgi:hypothetical protein